MKGKKKPTSRQSVKKLRDEGLSYTQIAKAVGISKQRVGQILTKKTRSRKYFDHERAKRNREREWGAFVLLKRPSYAGDTKREREILQNMNRLGLKEKIMGGIRCITYPIEDEWVYSYKGQFKDSNELQELGVKVRRKSQTKTKK